MIKKISIIIPCYNEERTLPEILTRVLNSNSLGLEKEIIVVNDGSTDRTFEIAQSFSPLVKNVSYELNKGKGFAVREGLKHVTGEVVLIQDADLEYDPKDYPAMIKPFLDNADVVYGIRRRRQLVGKMIFNPYFWGGLFVNLLLNILSRTKIDDVHVGYKAFKASIITHDELVTDGFTFCHELTLNFIDKNIPIIQVPISYSPRTMFEGKKIRFKDGLEASLFICQWFFKVTKKANVEATQSVLR